MNQQLNITAPDTLKDARQLYIAHKATSPKASKIENLDKLWEVLNSIREEGGRDFSIAEVGRRLESIDGPKTQSLRNAQGTYYREIITAFANAVSGSTRYVAKTKSNVDQALDLITDPSVKVVLKDALHKAKRLQVVNDNLHAAFKSLSVGVEPLQQTVNIKTNTPSKTTAIDLNPRLRIALSKGIDASRLAQQGMSIESDGSITNEHGDTLFPPAFVLAIRTVLGEKDNF